MSRIIKRYNNRKLYDTETSSYVSRGDIARMIRDGESIMVTNKDETEDHTASVLAQIIAEQDKQEAGMPASVLHDLIRLNQSAVDQSLKQMGTALEKLGMIPGEQPAATLQESCRDLEEKLSRLEQRVEEISDSVSQ